MTTVFNQKQNYITSAKMSELSGYDSEIVGFDCITQDKNAKTASSSQTTEFYETGSFSQTNFTRDVACLAVPDETPVSTEYPDGLNEFLRKVVPAMMEQLDQSDFLNNSSDSEDEEIISAKAVQLIESKDVGSGDHETSILDISWSSSGNSFAVSIGQTLHETWCQSPGLIKIYTLKRSEEFVHNFNVSESNCVSCLKYHPSVAALLAYGTTSGQVVICNMMNTLDEGMQLASPSECHGLKRVTALAWADASLANLYLLMQINNKKKRRGAADQVLFSSGADGTINAWQVNANLKVFENIITYKINMSRTADPFEVTCFDFIKTQPLRPSEEKISDDIFVVGTQTGKIYLCKVHGVGDIVDPVYDEVEPHGTCVLDVGFNSQKPGVFVSISMDSELRVYDVNQGTPLKVICLDIPISCLSWLIPPFVVVGFVGGEDLVKVYNVGSGKAVPIAGLAGHGDITCLSVSQNGNRIAAGDKSGTVRIWELPARRIRLSVEDLDF